MNNETLEQLKIKPIPKKPQQFQVLIQIPSEGVAPNIIDKTSERLINREQFFSDLQENLGVVQKDYIKTKKPSAKIKENEIIESKKLESEKQEPKKKGRKSKEEIYEGHKSMFANMAPNMIDDGIKAISKEIEDYNKEDKTNVLEKEGSDDLNQN